MQQQQQPPARRTAGRKGPAARLKWAPVSAAAAPASSPLVTPCVAMAYVSLVELRGKSLRISRRACHQLQSFSTNSMLLSLLLKGVEACASISSKPAWTTVVGRILAVAHHLAPAGASDADTWATMVFTPPATGGDRSAPPSALFGFAGSPPFLPPHCSYAPIRFTRPLSAAGRHASGTRLSSSASRSPFHGLPPPCSPRRCKCHGGSAAQVRTETIQHMVYLH